MRVMPTLAVAAIFALVQIALVTSFTSAAELDDLQALRCVATTVKIDEEPHARRAITDRELSDSLIVAVRSKLPRLSIDQSCPNLLLAFATVGESSSGPSLAVGLVQLQLYRQATLSEVGRSASVGVWNLMHHSWGPAPGAKRRVMEGLEELVTRFAADYYRAGNL